MVVSQHLTPAVLDAFESRQLPPDEGRVVAAHLEGCAECRHTYAQLRHERAMKEQEFEEDDDEYLLLSRPADDPPDQGAWLQKFVEEEPPADVMPRRSARPVQLPPEPVQPARLTPADAPADAPAATPPPAVREPAAPRTRRRGWRLTVLLLLFALTAAWWLMQGPSSDPQPRAQLAPPLPRRRVRPTPHRAAPPTIGAAPQHVGSAQSGRSAEPVEPSPKRAGTQIASNRLKPEPSAEIPAKKTAAAPDKAALPAAKAPARPLPPRAIPAQSPVGGDDAADRARNGERILARWLGRWETEFTYRPTKEFPRAGKTPGVTHTVWAMPGRLLQSFWLADDGSEQWLAFFSFDNERDEVRSWLFSPDGDVLPQRGAWSEKDKVLSLRAASAAAEIVGGTTHRFSSSNRYQTRWQVENTREDRILLDVRSGSRRSELPPFPNPPTAKPMAAFSELRPLARWSGKWSVAQDEDDSSPNRPELHRQAATVRGQFVLGGRFLMLRHRSAGGRLNAVSLTTWQPGSQAYQRWTFSADGKGRLWNGRWQAKPPRFTWNLADSKADPTGSIEERWPSASTAEAQVTLRNAAGEILMTVRKSYRRRAK